MALPKKSVTNFFEILKVPVSFNLDKQLLKKNYFYLSKSEKNDHLMNKAFSILNDDYLRALEIYRMKNKRIINENSINSDVFLSECLDIEEAIYNNRENKEELNKISDILNKEIELCKDNYTKMEYLNKWSYLRRLKSIIDEYM